MSLEKNANLIDDVEMHLEEADQAAELSNTRFSTGEVLGRVRRRIDDSHPKE